MSGNPILRTLALAASTALLVTALAVPVAAAETAYKISLQTAIDDDAGTNANVTIRLWGTLGTSSELELNNSGDDRVAGHTDVYVKKVPEGSRSHLEGRGAE